MMLPRQIRDVDDPETLTRLIELFNAGESMRPQFDELLRQALDAVAKRKHAL